MSATTTKKSNKVAKPERNGLSPQRLTVLKALAKAGPQGDTLAALEKRTELPPRAVYHHAWHLHKDGFASKREICVEDAPGTQGQVRQVELRYSLTAAGRKLASKAS